MFSTLLQRRGEGRQEALVFFERAGKECFFWCVCCFVLLSVYCILLISYCLLIFACSRNFDALHVIVGFEMIFLLLYYLISVAIVYRDLRYVRKGMFIDYLQYRCHYHH